MSDFKNPSGTGFGMGSWRNARNNYSGNQIKVALQRQGQAGMNIGPGLRTKMQGYQGYAHADNPLGKYQGPYGNLGLTAYNEAKAAGWKPQDIYDEIQSGRSGMFMPEGAMNQYNMDIEQEENQTQWKSDLQTQMADLTSQINEPVAPTGVGYSAPSVVGKSGTRGANLKIAERGSRSGTKRWKRGGDSSWSMATVNTGGTSGKASNSSAVNV